MSEADDETTKIGKGHRGNASQFFVAGELCRRGHSAVVTLGNTPNVDILCSNLTGTRFVHVQVKTFPKGAGKCIVGKKAEIDSGISFFWILVGLPAMESNEKIEYFVVPASVMARKIKLQYDTYLKTPGAKGQQRKKTSMRTVAIPPRKNNQGWSIEVYRDQWKLIDKALK